MKKTILVFSALIVALLVLFQISKYSLLVGDLQIELVIAIIAIVFFGIGVYLNKRSLAKNDFDTSNGVYTIDHEKIAQLGLSHRESEVLVELSMGLSNKEIGDKLFISENTIKTHVSSIYSKLNVSRRTQAIKKAKDLQIIQY